MTAITSASLSVGEQGIRPDTGAVVMRGDRGLGLGGNLVAQPLDGEETMLAAVIAGFEDVEVMAEADDFPKIGVGCEHLCELAHHKGNEPRVSCPGCRAQVLAHQDICLRGS